MVVTRRFAIVMRDDSRVSFLRSGPLDPLTWCARLSLSSLSYTKAICLMYRSMSRLIDARNLTVMNPRRNGTRRVITRMRRELACFAGFSLADSITRAPSRAARSMILDESLRRRNNLVSV